MSTALPNPYTASQDYWLGWLGSAFGLLLREVEADDDYGPGTISELALDRARRAWQGFAASPFIAGMEHYDEQQWAGYVVESVDGEPQAFRPTLEEATAAVASVEAYYYEAATCGHPLAAGWVEAKQPFRVRQITKAERDDMDTPVVDREP